MSLLDFPFWPHGAVGAASGPAMVQHGLHGHAAPLLHERGVKRLGTVLEASAPAYVPHERVDRRGPVHHRHWHDVILKGQSDELLA